MPLIYHEGYSLGDGAGNNQLLKDTVGWTGKNLIPLPYEFGNQQTQGGITAKTNADGSITFNGTVTASISFRLKGRSIHDNNYFLVKPGKYIFSCGNIENNFYWGIATTKNNSYSAIADGLHTSTYELTITSDMSDEAVDGAIPLAIYANFRTLGDVYNNFTVYPMLRRADILDDTYEPYHESVEEVVEQIYADNGVLGAKNLLPNELEAKTVGGVTVTINDDNSVTLNGTATELLDYQLQISAKIKDILEVGKRYILTGCPANGSTTSYCLVWRLNNASSPSMPDIDDGDGSEFTWQQYTGTVALRIRIQSGYTCNNLTFKPMIRLASDPDDTYQPYAMTNRELMENVSPIEITDNWLTLPTDITKGGQYTVFKIGKLIIVNIVLCRNAGFDDTEFAIPINSQYQPIKQINANAIFQPTQYITEGSVGYLYVADKLIIRNMQSTPVNFCKINIAYICK